MHPYPYLNEEKGGGFHGRCSPLLIPTDLTGHTKPSITTNTYIPILHPIHPIHPIQPTPIHSFIHSLFSRLQIATATQPQGACFPRFVASESAKFTLSGEVEQEQEGTRSTPPSSSSFSSSHLRLHQPAFGPPRPTSENSTSVSTTLQVFTHTDSVGLLALWQGNKNVRKNGSRYCAFTRLWLPL